MLTAILPLAAACGNGKAALRAACPAGQLCLEYGNSQEPSTLDPQKESGDWEVKVIEELIVGLTDSDPQGRTIPGMATHWETSADGLTWTFHLRDALWSDGLPVTADDFVVGLRRLMDPKLAATQASQIYAIKNARAVNGGKLPLEALGVRAVDPKTLEIKLEHPWPILADYATAPIMGPAPRRAVEKWGDDWVRPGHFLSNGPYTLVSWKLGDRIVLQKNPRYYDAAKICFDRVSFYPTVDSVTAERQVKRGELDLNTLIVPNRVPFLRRPGQMPEYVHTHRYVGVIFLIFNMRDVPALKDRRVRQALSMAVDRQFITGKLLRGGQQPADTFAPYGLIDYDNPVHFYWAGWSFERRQAEAKRLLAQAGYGPTHPLHLELKHRNNAESMLIMPAVQADLKAVGVQVDLIGNESMVAYAAFNAKDFQIGDAGWVGGNDVYGFLYLHRRDTGAQNWSGYSNPRYDALLDAANNQPDPKKRMALMGQAEQFLLDDMPIAPLYYPGSRNLVSPNITGWQDNDLDVHKIGYLCFKDAAARRAAGRR